MKRDLEVIRYTNDMDSPNDGALEILANPFYAVTFTSHVFKKHSNLGSKEDWVAANAFTLRDIGAKIWLDEFLDFISQSRAKYDGHDILNPTLVVNISDRLQGDHEPLASREHWIQINEKAISEIGAETWLWRLLEVLETGGPEPSN
jgi:hypothetical protein